MLARNHLKRLIIYTIGLLALSLPTLFWLQPERELLQVAMLVACSAGLFLLMSRYAHILTPTSNKAEIFSHEQKPQINRQNEYSKQRNQLKVYPHDILANSPLGACAINDDNQVVVWNNTLEQLSMIKAHNALGKYIEDLPPPWNEALEHLMVCDEKQLLKYRAEFNSRTAWFNFHKTPLGNTSTTGCSAGVVILIEDVTERHTLEMELAHSERFASVGRLAAGIAHEIGNPITAIACITQHLQAESSNKDVTETAEKILSQTKRVADIVQSLIHFSQNQEASKNIKQPFFLKPVIDEAISLVKLSFKGKTLVYVNHCGDELQIQGDSQRILQVFLNLLENARDASKKNGLIKIESTSNSKEHVISIKDHGEGIPSNLQSRIFEPFFTTKLPGKGTGLGLPVAYSILKDHGGHIYISSFRHHGTEVFIRLPKITNLYTNNDIRFNQAKSRETTYEVNIDC